MAKTIKKKDLYRNKWTGYIYSVAYRVPIHFNSHATPEPGKVELLTLAFQGEHPDHENTIVTTDADFRNNFEQYIPIQSTTPTPGPKVPGTTE